MPVKPKPVPADIAEHQVHEETLAREPLRIVSRKEARATQPNKEEGITSANEPRIHACVLPAIVQQPPRVAVFPGPRTQRQQPQCGAGQRRGRMGTGGRVDGPGVGGH
jgi:hypothetical protein